VSSPTPKSEDNMNQPTTNSCIINNPSASSAASSLSSPACAGRLAQPGNKPGAPAETHLPKAATRKSKSGVKAAAKQQDRCRHFTSTGRRCRLAVLDPASGLCFRHVGLQFQASDEDLSPAFLGLLSGFQSASQIHAFLTQVTVLLVQNRVSTRRAAILAYLGQILLRTLPAIEHELDPSDQDEEIIIDILRPQRDAEREDPERAMYTRMAELYGSAPSAEAHPSAGSDASGATISAPDKSK
jgi:hypothetical protein